MQNALREPVSTIWLCQKRRNCSLKGVFSPQMAPLSSPRQEKLEVSATCMGEDGVKHKGVSHLPFFTRRPSTCRRLEFPVGRWEVLTGYINYGTQAVLRETKCPKMLLSSENNQLSRTVSRILSKGKRRTPQSWFAGARMWSFLFISPRGSCPFNMSIMAK